MNETDNLLGILAGRADFVSEDKLKIVEQHIAKFERWAPNEVMLERLRNALDRDREIAGADLSFYYHELFEAQRTSLLIQPGMSFEEAQPIARNQAIAEYGVSRTVYIIPKLLRLFPMSLTKTGVTPGESTGKMITLNLSGYRKARVWLGEVPDLSYPVVEVLEFTIDTKKSAIALRRRAAVEIFVPTGGCFIYGLLEAAFAPEESGQMILQVAVSADTGNQVDWALAAGVDEVCVGLPREYSESVLETASDAAKILGSGVLRFAGAAHGAVGSSRRIFRQLATTAVRLLTCQPDSVSQEELAVLVSTCFR